MCFNFSHLNFSKCFDACSFVIYMAFISQSRRQTYSTPIQNRKILYHWRYDWVFKVRRHLKITRNVIFDPCLLIFYNNLFTSLNTKWTANLWPTNGVDNDFQKNSGRHRDLEILCRIGVRYNWRKGHKYIESLVRAREFPSELSTTKKRSINRKLMT